MTSVAASVGSPDRPSFATNWDSKSKLPLTSTSLLSPSSSPASGAGAKISHGEFGSEFNKSPAGDADMRKMKIEVLPNSPKNDQNKIAALGDASSDRSSDCDRKSVHESGSSRTSRIDDIQIISIFGLGSGSVDEESGSLEIELDDISSSDEASMLGVKENDQDPVEEEGSAAAVQKSMDETSPQTPPQEVQRIDNNGIASPAKSTREDQYCQGAPFTPPHDVCDVKTNTASGLYYPASPSRSSRRGKSCTASPAKATRKEKDCQGAPFTPPQDQFDHVKKNTASGLYYPPSPSRSLQRGSSGISSPVKVTWKEPACRDFPYTPPQEEYGYVEAAPDVHYPHSPGRSPRRGVIVPRQNTVEDIIETIATSSISRMPSSTQLQCFVKDKKPRVIENQQQTKKLRQRKKLKQFPPPRQKKVKKGRMLGMKPDMEADGLIRDPSFVSKPAKPLINRSNNEGGTGRNMFSRFRSQ